MTTGLRLHRAGNVATAIGAAEACESAFAATGKLPVSDDSNTPRAVNDGQPVEAVVMDLGKVSAKPVSRWLMVAYDDVYSINYFGKRLRAYWRRSSREAANACRDGGEDRPGSWHEEVRRV